MRRRFFCMNFLDILGRIMNDKKIMNFYELVMGLCNYIEEFYIKLMFSIFFFFTHIEIEDIFQIFF